MAGMIHIISSGSTLLAFFSHSQYLDFFRNCQTPPFNTMDLKNLGVKELHLSVNRHVPSVFFHYEFDISRAGVKPGPSVNWSTRTKSTRTLVNSYLVLTIGRV